MQIPPWPPLNVITPWHTDALGGTIRPSWTTLTQAASGAMVLNVVQYYPFRMYVSSTAVKMSLFVGATNTGNVDVGIYDSQKNRLINSGTTALGTANTLQEFDITDTALNPGLYFMACTFSSSSGTSFRVSQVDDQLMCLFPVYDETTAGFGLPATAAFVASTTAAPLAVAMGVHFSTLV